MGILGGGGTTYPAGIDTSTTEIDSPNANKTIIAAAKINDLAAAIIAIETELGINPAGSLGTVVARLAVEHKADGAHEDLTADSVTVNGDMVATAVKDELGVIAPTGVIQPYIGATAPAGWILANGGTISDAGDGGTTRANADTLALFTLLWDNFADAQAPVSTGRGASAADDFTAGKTITIPDLRGKFPGGVGGTAMATLGDNGGSETHTLVESEIPAHTHGQRAYATGTGGGHTSSGQNENSTSDGQVTLSTGGDGAHENMPPWVALAYIIKL